MTVEHVVLRGRAFGLDDGTSFELWTEEEGTEALTAYVEDREGLVVGRLRIARRAGHEAADFSVWTAPHLRGRGIGRRLVAEGITWAARQDVPFLDVEVGASDRSLRTFLTRCELVVASRTCEGTTKLAVLVPGASHHRMGPAADGALLRTFEALEAGASEAEAAALCDAA